MSPSDQLFRLGQTGLEMAESVDQRSTSAQGCDCTPGGQPSRSSSEAVAQNRVAGNGRESLNPLFEILSEWETQLQALNFEWEGPSR